MRLTVPVPRPPLGPDPLRRIDVPPDLSAITAIGDEADPHEVGM